MGFESSKFESSKFEPSEDISPALQQLLDQHQAELAATLRPYIEIELQPQTHLTPWQSKVGGQPYLPLGWDYPVGAEGEPLQFLAQINFAEMPSLPQFPQTGILAFYISAGEGLYGANFEDLDARDNFRVFYFADLITNPSELITDFSFLPEFTESPLLGSAALRFIPQEAPVSGGDYRFNELLGPIFASVEDGLRWEYREKVASGEGHRIGGYPGFTQADPRDWQASYRIYDCLLLQLDSQVIAAESGQPFELMWGDTGIANFFISSEALAKLDFSAVLFNWDCC
jgi:uncharacterized protein YwqG